MLADLGHEVCAVAASAIEAREAILATRPDALLVDIDLGPGGNGLDVAIEAYVLRGLRTLFVSGNLDGWVERAVRAIRPYGFLAKPFPAEALAERLKEVS